MTPITVEGGNAQVKLTSKRILQYLLQANGEIRPLCIKPLKACEKCQLLYVRAPDKYMGY